MASRGSQKRASSEDVLRLGVASKAVCPVQSLVSARADFGSISKMRPSPLLPIGSVRFPPKTVAGENGPFLPLLLPLAGERSRSVPANALRVELVRGSG